MNTKLGPLALWQWFVILGSIGVTWGLIYGVGKR